MSAPRIIADQTVLLVIDLQDKLLLQIDGGPRIVEQAARLIRGCALLGVPIIVTEQYPKALGPTTETVRQALPESSRAAIQPKMKFSALIEATRRKIADSGRSTVLLCGIESHVCVMQTSLDLLDAGYMTAVASDAIGSRRSADHDAAMRRMSAAGVVPVSVEMVLLEMVHEAGTDLFKAMLPIIK